MSDEPAITRRRLLKAARSMALCSVPALLAVFPAVAIADVIVAPLPWTADGIKAMALARMIAAADSRDSLFDDDKPKASSPSRDAPNAEAQPIGAPAWSGFVRGELARTYASPAHWSKMLVRAELDGRGKLTPDISYKIGARVDYDFVYDATSFYPHDVEHDQRFNPLLRENYVDISAGDNWEFRLGRQHIVWGEMVGLFFADVVSAKDLREFILPDFEVLRIPQWATQAEYFNGNFHAEAIWIPVPSYDNIGKPGAEFFPAVPAPPPGFATLYDNEQFPQRKIANTNYGLRLSNRSGGWDVSGFYYHSMDALPTFYRDVVVTPQPAFVYQARHDRIDQVGGTLAQEFGSVVFKAESVYTRGRSYSVLRADDDGVVRQNTLDVVAGLDFTLGNDTRLNVQAFNRTFFDHDPDIVPSRNETGMSLLVNHKLNERFEAEVLYIASVNRSDWMVRPRVLWNYQKNWQFILGVDIFEGPPLGLFGQYDNRDRVYTEARYRF